jgi:hypothetical protein
VLPIALTFEDPFTLLFENSSKLLKPLATNATPTYTFELAFNFDTLLWLNPSSIG